MLLPELEQPLLSKHFTILHFFVCNSSKDFVLNSIFFFLYNIF